MKVIPLAAESLGVRSMATYVEVGRTGILIDPGATLASSRFGLPPAEEEGGARGVVAGGAATGGRRVGGAAARERPDLGVRGARRLRLREPLPRGSFPIGPRLVRRATRALEGPAADDRRAAGPAGRPALDSARLPRAGRERGRAPASRIRSGAL